MPSKENLYSNQCLENISNHDINNHASNHTRKSWNAFKLWRNLDTITTCKCKVILCSSVMFLKIFVICVLTPMALILAIFILHVGLSWVVTLYGVYFKGIYKGMLSRKRSFIYWGFGKKIICLGMECLKRKINPSGWVLMG